MKGVYKNTMSRIFSFDAEATHLFGTAFSVGAIVYENEKEISRFIARCKLNSEMKEEMDPWIAEDVYPAIKKIPITHDSYESMLKSFIQYYLKYRNNTVILAHMSAPVECKLFIDAVEKGYCSWDANPYPLTDCSAIPEIGTSVDAYNRKNGIKVPDFDGGTHNPLYDSAAAALAYIDWHKKYAEKNKIYNKYIEEYRKQKDAKSKLISNTEYKEFDFER